MNLLEKIFFGLTIVVVICNLYLAEQIVFAGLIMYPYAIALNYVVIAIFLIDVAEKLWNKNRK